MALSLRAWPAGIFLSGGGQLGGSGALREISQDQSRTHTSITSCQSNLTRYISTSRRDDSKFKKSGIIIHDSYHIISIKSALRQSIIRPGRPNQATRAYFHEAPAGLKKKVMARDLRGSAEIVVSEVREIYGGVCGIVLFGVALWYIALWHPMTGSIHPSFNLWKQID